MRKACSQYITKFYLETGEIVNVAPVYHQKYLDITDGRMPCQIGSTNNVLFTGGVNSSKLFALNSHTLMPFWSYYAYADIEDLIDDNFALTMVSPVSAGHDIFAPAGGEVFYEECN